MSTLTAIVATGKWLDGQVCAHRIEAPGVVSTEAAACAVLDEVDRATLTLQTGSAYLLIAAGLRERDPPHHALDHTLEAIAMAVPGSQRVTVSLPGTFAVAGLRARNAPLMIDAYDDLLDRIGRLLLLDPQQVRAIPVFGTDGGAMDPAAHAIAALAALGGINGPGDSIDQFGRAFATAVPDEALATYDQSFRATLASALGVDATTLPAVYGYQGTAGPAATIDASQQCFVRALGIWLPAITRRSEPADFGLCIARAPQTQRCDATFLSGLDFSGVTIHGANYSAELLLRTALAAFTTARNQYRLEFSASCDDTPTLDAALFAGRLYSPGFLAPMP